MLWPAAMFAAVTPYPPYPGALPSVAYQVAVDGQPVFVHNFLTYDQFNWMDYASFAMTGKVHVTVTNLVSERKLMTCHVRPLARHAGRTRPRQRRKSVRSSWEWNPGLYH